MNQGGYGGPPQGGPGSPPGQAPDAGQGQQPPAQPGYGPPQPGYGPPQQGYPQQGYGPPQSGYGPPQQGYGAPGYGPPGSGPPGYAPYGYQQPGYGPQGAWQQRPPANPPPAWVGWVARGFLILGILMLVGTGVVAATSSEEAGMQMAQATMGPLGFGITATLLTRKTSTGGAAKPLGFGCLTGFGFLLALAFFFSAIWPSL